MAEAWWGVCVRCNTLSTLLIELRALDDVFNHFFLVCPVLVVAPPHWSLVFALQAKMFAGAARRLSLIALLSSQTACEASYRVRVRKMSKRRIPAVREEATNLSVSDGASLLLA